MTIEQLTEEMDDQLLSGSKNQEVSALVYNSRDLGMSVCVYQRSQLRRAYMCA